MIFCECITSTKSFKNRQTRQTIFFFSFLHSLHPFTWNINKLQETTESAVVLMPDMRMLP